MSCFGWRGLAAALGLACAVVGVAAQAVAQDCLAAHPAPKSVEDGYLDATSFDQWRTRSNIVAGKLRGDLSRIRLVVIGDSIAENWPAGMLASNPAAVLNLGVRGDTAANLEWRVANLPVAPSLRPQVVVVEVGTNDVGAGVDSALAACDITHAIADVQRRFPSSRVLVVGLLPNGAHPMNPNRNLIVSVNMALQAYAQSHSMVFANPGPSLVDPDGELSDTMAYDYLHPTWAGYAKLSQALRPVLANLAQGD